MLARYTSPSGKTVAVVEAYGEDYMVTVKDGEPPAHREVTDSYRDACARAHTMTVESPTVEYFGDKSADNDPLLMEKRVVW